MPTDHPEFVHSSTPGQAERLIEEVVASVSAAGGRAVIGPWLGEVGFEVLYWIPFLHWLCRTHAIGPENVTVVSRGGAEAWYQGLCDRYVDVFDSLTTEEFRKTTLELWSATGGLQKQVHFRDWDERILNVTLGEEWHDRALIHPMLVYRLFRNVWQAALPLREFLDRAAYPRWRRPEDEALVSTLPEDFTAVRFYFRESFSDTPANRALVHDVIGRLASRRPVVLLNTGVVVDDHVDAEPATGPGILRPLAGVPPARNLYAQSVIIARARLFVGTYGGLAHVGPFYGVPAVGFATDPTTINPVHLTLHRRTAAEHGTWLAVVDGRGFDLLDAAAGMPGR